MAGKGKKKEAHPNKEVKPDKDAKPETNDSCPDKDARANKNDQRSDNDARADKVLEWKISIIGAMILGAFGVIGTLASHWIIENSANAKRCDKLEADVRQKDATIAERDAHLEAVVMQKDTIIAEKDARLEAVVRQKDALIAEKDARLADKSERIADQRAEISVLKQTVLLKDVQLDVKESTITSYKLKATEPGGRMVTRTDDAILKTAHGSVKDRLGVDYKRPILDQVKATWNKPLAFDMRPGIFIPAPQELPDDYIAMHNSYYAGDYSNPVNIATNIYAKISPMIEPFSGRGKVDIRFALAASETYRIMAESAFHQGQYKRASYLMGQSAGLAGKTPPPELLALESAMAYRARESQGFLTCHISDVLKANPDEKYRNEILNELAKLGYLQRFLPNKDFTDIGEPMDWEKLCKQKLDLRKLEKRNGDVWSTRWKGFGEYEEFNLSQEFRNDLKAFTSK